MSQDHAVAFAERLLMLLDLGSFTSTYKYAVLLGLIDLCLEHTTRSGGAPTSVTTSQLARKVLELYWPHTAPFDPASDLVLLQNNGGQAEVLTRIRAYRAALTTEPLQTLTQARRADPRGLDKLERFIEWKLVEMPLPRLQVFGAETDAFLYSIGWAEGVTKREFEGPAFDNRILLQHGAGEHLVRLSSLLRPLIQREWLARVARFNRETVEHARLEAFLFGVQREALAPVRGALRALQSDRCFYCDQRLRAEVEVDHFIPWARYPDNGIENLVVADRRCNGSKRAFLAAADHVARWAARVETSRVDLGDIARQTRWERDPGRTLAVARGIYLRLPLDAKLWRGHDDFVSTDRRLLAETLAAG